MGDRSSRQYSSKKENQEPNKRKQLYSIDSISIPDWKLFMWFASLETIENCIHLFIVVWNAIPMRGSAEFTKDFNEETDEMIQIIGEINIPKADSSNYSKTLSNYRKYRHSSSDQDQEARCELVDNIWIRLESCGLQYYSYDVANQLKRCTLFQKNDLRRMVLTRMKSFRSFARLIQESVKDVQIKEAKKDNHIQEEKNETRKSSGKKLKDENFNSQAVPDNKSKDDNRVKSLSEENEMLKNKISGLMKENSQQQAALGNLTNVSWNDDDPNSTAKLITDIEELQDMLDDFTMVQGSDYKINDQNAADFLNSNECQTKYPSTKANLVLGALFRRRIIKTILDDVHNHLNNIPSGDNDPIKFLENSIVRTTEYLIQHIKLFGDNREGEDDITKITPVKIRQHVYSALSCRGLTSKHPKIKEIADILLTKMNNYREVVDEETRNELQDQAIQITCKVINIFCFRLKTQASIPTYRFFQAGQDLDPRLMQGAFSGSDAKNLEVEACGFPCISILNGDNSNPRVITKAQVIARPKSRKSGDKSDDKSDGKSDKSGDKSDDKSKDKNGVKIEDKDGVKIEDNNGVKSDDRKVKKNGSKNLNEKENRNNK